MLRWQSPLYVLNVILVGVPLVVSEDAQNDI